MPASPFSPLATRHSSLLGIAARIPLLMLPAALLLAAADRVPERNNLILWFGVAFQAIIGVVALSTRRAWRQSMVPVVITIYLTALSWLWFGDTIDDWLNHFARAV